MSAIAAAVLRAVCKVLVAAAIGFAFTAGMLHAVADWLEARP